MSSDSESDDLYDNISSKLQSIKNAFYQEETASSALLVESVNISIDNSVIDAQEPEKGKIRQMRSQKEKIFRTPEIYSDLNDFDDLEASVELPEISMPEKRLTRSSRKTIQTAEPSVELPPKKVKGRKKAKKVNAGPTQSTSQVGQTTKKNTKKVRARKKKSGNNQTNPQSSQQEILQTNTEINTSIINIGVHEGYHDANENQLLFRKSAKATVISDSITIDDSENDESFIEQNPEVPITVFWKSRDYVKFSLRKFQKLSQMYEHFAKKENVPKENVLFTYNNKILSPDDSLDSINYRIVQFIEGGVLDYNVSKFLGKNFPSKPSTIISGGISLKFQCQHQKKCYEAILAPNERLIIAMMKYAEHIEKPFNKLRFYFDGDILQSNLTPSQADIEGGECIDVKVID